MLYAFMTGSSELSEWSPRHHIERAKLFAGGFIYAMQEAAQLDDIASVRTAAVVAVGSISAAAAFVELDLGTNFVEEWFNSSFFD